MTFSHPDRSHGVLAVLGVMLGLACRGGDPPADTSAVAAAPPSVARSALTLTAEGFGPVRIGMSRQLVFETDGRVVTAFRAGMLPMVRWVEGCS